ncbi:MAG: phosphotransferase [Rhodobacter sp.]|nr:phosphotransferase [Paracoccaceae bacterium]MCC0075830.1 phosphotransferase [Rhodobacter sp.]
MPADSPLSPALDAALTAALALPVQRVLALDVEGRRYWLKRPERHKSWIRRLQKGDPARALAADREGLQALAARDLPAPRIAAAGEDFLLIEDAGRPVSRIIRDQNLPEAERHRVLIAAAEALAKLHRAGVVHGRPKIRDICWNAGRGATLIDFEAFRDGAADDALGRDAMVFLHSVLQVRRGRDAFYDTAAAAYRAAAPERAWPAMCRRVKRFRWLMLPARLALAVKPKAPELRGAVILYRILFASGNDAGP